MFQEFYKDTLIGRYIKSLLSQTEVPLYTPMFEGNYIIKDCFYVYHNNIILCNQTGMLSHNSENYEIVSSLDNADKRLFSTYMSDTNVYDPKTHYHLGRYLRFLRSTQDINVLPFYNCYNSMYVSNVLLQQVTDQGNKTTITASKTNTANYKLICVPVIIGKKYTIAIDSDKSFLVRPTLFSSKGLLTDLEATYAKKYLNKQSKVITNSSMHAPFEFSFDVDETNQDILKTLYKFTDSIYLMIQLPKDNISSIVVLEDYKELKKTVIDCSYASQWKFDGVLSPSLLSGNTLTSYAFSPRLVEYITDNVIHPGSKNHKNIEKIQDAFCIHNESYRSKFLNKEYKKGLWDPMLSRLIYDLVLEDVECRKIYDQDGNVNKDVETLLHKKGILY